MLILFASSFRVVSQSNAYVIESLGRYHTTWGTGIHFLIPFVYRIVKKISLNSDNNLSYSCSLLSKAEKTKKSIFDYTKLEF